MGDLVPIRPVVEPRSVEPRTVEPLWREVVGQLLRDRRHDRGEKLTETAGRAGVSTQYLSEVERGRKEPSSEVISAVAGALDLTLLDVTVGVARRLSVAGSMATGRPRGGTPLALAA
jgi:transcriptional regulator with XRE-family HTH domain